MTVWTMLIAFLVGGIPFGWLLACAYGVDVRGGGSGNIGATNVLRLTNKYLGALTLLLDALKGWGPTAVGLFLEGERLAAGMGWAAIIGHVYSPYLSFRGGKGVATAMGVFVALSPSAVGGAVIAFVIALRIFGRAAAGSLVAACVLPLLIYLSGEGGYVCALSLSASVLISVRHVGNVRQMFSLNETTDLECSRPGAEDPKKCVRGDIRPGTC